MRLPALVDVTCKRVVEWFEDYLEDPGFAAADRVPFEQHLYACTWCMDYLHQLQGAQRAARQLADADAQLPESSLLAMFRGLRAPAPRSEPEANGQLAFKFLMPGAVGAISRFRWPRPRDDEPGAWVEVPHPIEPCRAGIHACDARELSSWLHDELWLVELAGPQQPYRGGVVAARGRLVREVVAWREGVAMRFAEAAHQHARRRVLGAPQRNDEALHCVDCAAAHLPRGNVALAAFCAAMAIARLRGRDHFEQRGYDAERRWQSRWIRRELGLEELLRAGSLRRGA